MPSPLLINDAGLFNSVRRTLFVFDDTLDKLRRLVAEREAAVGVSGTVTEKRLLAKQQQVVALLESLPAGGKQDSTWGLRGSGTYRVLVAPANERFVTSSNGMVQGQDTWNLDTTTWHLDTGLQLNGLRKVLDGLNDALQAAYPADAEKAKYHVPGFFRLSTLSAAAKLAQQLQAGTITVQEENPQKDLAEAQAFAVYVRFKDGGGGYLDGRGNYTPALGAARLFESQKAAETTIKNRRLGGAVPVALEVRMKGLGTGHSEAGFEKLGAAVSEVRRQSLHKALEDADLETLQARVKELESRLGVTETSPVNDTPAPRRNRM